jgi:prephenate dehydrogenase
MRFAKVAVIGVGLIGGSFALALKAAKLAGTVAGAGRGAANLKLALEQGVIDSIARDAADAARDADLVLVAAPVAQFSPLFAAIAPVLKPGALITDAGSTKRDVVAAARAGLGAKLARFVPAHPIAGAERLPRAPSCSRGGASCSRRSPRTPRRRSPPSSRPGRRAGRA